MKRQASKVEQAKVLFLVYAKCPRKRGAVQCKSADHVAGIIVKLKAANDSTPRYTSRNKVNEAKGLEIVQVNMNLA